MARYQVTVISNPTQAIRVQAASPSEAAQTGATVMLLYREWPDNRFNTYVSQVGGPRSADVTEWELRHYPKYAGGGPEIGARLRVEFAGPRSPFEIDEAGITVPAQPIAPYGYGNYVITPQGEPTTLALRDIFDTVSVTVDGHAPYNAIVRALDETRSYYLVQL